MLCGFFPVTLQLWRDWAAERAHWSLSFYSCYTHLLMGLISSSPLLPCPCLHFHISLSPSVSSHRLILSLWGADKNREWETQKDKEKAKDDKNKLETDRNGQKDLSKKRSSISLTFESLCNHWPLLVRAKRLWSADTQGKYVTVILFM